MNGENLLRRLWLGAVVVFFAICVFPVSNRLTRALGLILFVGVWLGLIGLQWRRLRVRFALLGVTCLVALFLVVPSSREPDLGLLRSDYVAGLRRYEGTRYFWGGESPMGIDCSGLIRRGLVDAVFLRGFRTLDPALVRHALRLWWHDTTASALADGHGALTTPVLRVASLNQLDHSKVRPGDLAVTVSGIHILAYLGNHRWIEADPLVGRVITLTAPADESWLTTPMNIVRWSILAD